MSYITSTPPRSSEKATLNTEATGNLEINATTESEFHLTNDPGRHLGLHTGPWEGPYSYYT